MAAGIIRPHKSRSMICSMTGYAAATRDLPVASLAAELKSVNGRFLDVQFRLPDELAEASRKVRTAIPDAQPLCVGEALHWPGVLGDDRSALVREACVALVRELLEEFATTRSREGEKLGKMLLERVERLKSLLVSIQPRLPEAIAAYEEKLAARLREVLGGADEERIRQEIALFGVKADVAEELNRLGAHLDEVHRVVRAGGTVGKRLDFLMQELNREANTLGSKSVSKDLSDASLEFKLLIEQMREQIQNIE